MLLNSNSTIKYLQRCKDKGKSDLHQKEKVCIGRYTRENSVHSAFCETSELELQENIESLELKLEYNLSKEPIRIDFMIIN